TWAQIEAVSQKYNLPEVFALYLGGFDARKNLKALLRAWTFVSDGLGDEIKLVLAGNLPKSNSAFFPDPLKMAKELGIAEHIVSPGWIDEADKPALYSAARLFVYPSRYEGFGLPVLEAMACGAPVVAANAASLPELVGSAAFQLDPDDTKGLAASIISLTIQENTHNDMATKGYRQAQQFTWQKTATQTLQAYKDVLTRLADEIR
ncbi:MAG TPA: glycosyltransferase family 1 protein, partial [Anaerolineae bacterium]|nr:glycosyltransferase family 1 protein [Anaerolineae bacterium]